MTLERSPSHSWWWNSHNSPKNSKWLQSNLQELDEKVKEMLTLIEEDADSFAKRAEMYYQKRPELVNLVEEFYRAYRSLAERYDYLAGEIRQNIPKALQAQFGLSCDSPQSVGCTGRRHHYSPLGRSNQTFNNLLKKAGQAEDGIKGSSSIDKMQALECTTTGDNNGFHSSFLEHSNGNDHADGALEFSNREFSSDVEADNFTPSEKLQQKIENLEMENGSLLDANKKFLQDNIALQKEVEALEDRLGSVGKTTETCTHEADGLNLDSQRDVGEAKNLSCKTTVVGKVSCYEEGYEAASCFEGSAMEFYVSRSSAMKNDGDILECQGKDYSLDMDREALACTSSINTRILMEENKVLKHDLSERGEEKREAIRQLCLSIDMLKHENQRLLVLLASKNKRLQPLHQAWLKFFCFE